MCVLYKCYKVNNYTCQSHFEIKKILTVKVTFLENDVRFSLFQCHVKTKNMSNLNQK